MSKYDKSGEVPATSRTATCVFMPDGENKCGKEAHHIFQATVEIFGKDINIKKMVCEEHYRLIAGVPGAYSIGENNG